MINFDCVRSRGGLAYGLELAEAAVVGEEVTVVPWRFVPLAELDRAVLLEASRSLGGMVLRWSDAKDDEFTSAARRGDKQRQINTIPPHQSIEQLGAHIETAAAAMPVAAAGAVLQRSIDLATGCLFDLETSGGTADVEFRTDRARLLVGKDAEDVAVEGIGTDARLPRARDAAELIRSLESLVERLPWSPTGWHVEGAWLPSSAPVQVLQLRPIPVDRPTGPRVSDITTGTRTRFVWGRFDLKVRVDDNRAVRQDGSEVAVVVRHGPVSEMEQAVVACLAAARPVLVLHRAGGFRLTHEPYNLPDVELRARFHAVHLPESVGPHCRIVSDGDTAYFSRD